MEANRKRNIKKTIKKAVVAVAAASMLTVLTAPLAVMYSDNNAYANLFKTDFG